MTETSDKAHPNVTRGRVLLALLGLTLALLGSNPLKSPAEAENVLVWVNQQPVTSAQLAFAVERLTQGSPDILSTTQRQSILELLVDEELLSQRAQTLGLYGADPGIRKALVQAVIDQVVTDFLSRPVDVQQLRLFYTEHRSVFERPGRMAVEVLRFANLQNAQRAHAALLAGADIEDVGDTDEAGALSHLPSSPLPAHMLRRYLGSALTELALSLEQGEVSEPVRRSDGVYLVRAMIVEPAEVPEFDEVRVQVESEYRRRGREWALDQALAQLWQDADIDLNLNETDGLALAGERVRKHSQIFTVDTE